MSPLLTFWPSEKETRSRGPDICERTCTIAVEAVMKAMLVQPTAIPIGKAIARLGDDVGRHVVHADLWERYLEPDHV